MPYSDIVRLRQSKPAYSIREERNKEWETFIANDQFNELLSKTISAVRNNEMDKHKSIWIVGTYGSGKSHAGAVLKHLLCDPVDEIRDYVQAEYADPKYDSLRADIFQLRERKRLFPVSLYGQQMITHEEDLSLQIQKEVKLALRKADLDLTVQTDFDTYIRHIEDDEDFWKNLIGRNDGLCSVAPDVTKLKQALQNSDTSVLDEVRQALRNGRYDIRMDNTSLTRWIIEIQQELREKTDYVGLLFVWDEFTEIMQSPIGLRLNVQLQEVAEALENTDNDSYFMLISHPSAFNRLGNEEKSKTMGRYHCVTYNMETVSAFRIMTKKLQVIEERRYKELQDAFFCKSVELVNLLSAESAQQGETRKDIRNLFPFHPTTANLAAFYAREAGSSSRSVFEFMVSDPVRNFLDSEVEYEGGQTITADFLWDHVLDYFQSAPQRFAAVLEKYNIHHTGVEKQGRPFLRVFKGILLLNALNNIANSDNVTPTEKNIRNLFMGTSVEPQLDSALAFIDEKSVIQRQPDGSYPILFAALPGKEIAEKKKDLMGSQYKYTDQLIKFDSSTAKDSFGKMLATVVRPYVFDFFSPQANNSTLANKIENTRRGAKGYQTFLAVLIGRNNDEVNSLRAFASEMSPDQRFANVVFLVMETPLGEHEYELVFEYLANRSVAQAHNLTDQIDAYNKQAVEIIKDWLRRMGQGQISLFLNSGAAESVPGGNLARFINTVVTPRIFSSGPESLTLIRTKSSSTYWKQASVRTTVDAVLGFDSKQDVIKKVGGQGKHVEYLLQDSVDDDMNLKNTVSPDHPLKKVVDFIDDKFRRTDRNKTFNLGDKLSGLSQPPFGLFESFAPMAMVAFAMRKYRDQIFDTNGKQRTAQHLVEDVAGLFKAWEKGDKADPKLNFMFESKEAGTLTKRLVALFGLKNLKGYKDISSTKDARWAIQHEYCNEKGFPIWAPKYSDRCTPKISAFWENLTRIITDPDSTRNPSLIADTLAGYDELNIDLGNFLNPAEDNFRRGFVRFIKSDEVVSLQDDEVDEAVAFLRSHLQEVGLWSEENVKVNLKNWRIQKSIPQTPTPAPAEPTHPSPSPVAQEPTAPAPADQDELEKIRKDAVRKVGMSENLRQAIERLINEEDETVINIILRYV